MRTLIKAQQTHDIFDPSHSLAFSADGKSLVSGSGDMWDVVSGSELLTLRERTLGSRVALTADGKILAICDWNKIKLVELPNGREIRVLGHSKWVKSVLFSNDGRTLISSSYDKTIRIWDLSTGTIRLLSDGSWVNSIGLTADGRILARGSSGSAPVKLWELATGRELRTLVGHLPGVRSLAFSRDGTILVAGSNKGDGFDRTIAIKVWDVEMGQLVRTFVLSPKSVLFGLGSIALSSNGRILAASIDNAVILWDVSTSQQLHTFVGHSEHVTSVVFNPEGTILASGSFDETIKLWDVTTGRELRKLVGHVGLINSVKFNDDGKTLISGSDDGTVKQWHVVTGSLLHTFPRHSYEVTSVAFGGSGKFIAGGSSDGMIRLWRSDNHELIADLYSLDQKNWAVTTRDGRFDTNDLERIASLAWVFHDDPFRPLPAEIFMRDYYEPRLLPRLLGGEELPKVRRLADLNRVQPEVKVLAVKQGSRSDLAEVTVEVSSAEGSFERNGSTVTMRTDVHDLRLFRDGQLVGQWPEPKIGVAVISNGTNLTPAELQEWQEATRVSLDAKTRKATQTFTVRLPHSKSGQTVQFSAYAFNVDRVKSSTATQDYTVPQGLAMVRPRAYIISMGVNAYEEPSWDLRFAASDAALMQQGLEQRLGQYQVVTIKLVSDYKEINGIREVTEKHATKEALHAVLQILAGQANKSAALTGVAHADQLRRAEPDDLVLLTVSSHGYTDGKGLFYIIPSDSGDTDGQKIQSELLKKWISSDELSQWLRDVDAGDLVMIVDTCHSAATVESPGFKPGPMGSRGLGQLAYDKGMRILAASQADDVALESERIKQGLLTYALVKEGLEQNRASVKEDNKTQITLDSWLQYAADRVPNLYEEIRQCFADIRHCRLKGITIHELSPAGTGSLRNPNAFQQPSFFNFRKKSEQIILTNSTAKSRD